ncbi:MAG: MBL fold metallo-hydrolase, partial [Deltaproteobacteria bacterium]|nr:MBL fold metallo-hydrolase [Deltaproteobacteria bacterium]
MTPDGVKVTILVDNRAGDGLLSEHGLSFWIEADGKRILFDTGQGALEFNARILG